MSVKGLFRRSRQPYTAAGFALLQPSPYNTKISEPLSVSGLGPHPICRQPQAPDSQKYDRKSARNSQKLADTN
ncbi:predicted protein [Methanosarcina acetivorans C2A]|uniref:Uncharacterized protein n=1 Tax=Methanosarcina acetivorans (strain ATCC 35395 / DSM 2834 / JCM 12185 / C2A) TaxID=188937 RepID=Q8TKI8_METAC|nr:predicted protein [Methanosarcina acetivorans C2A]